MFFTFHFSVLDLFCWVTSHQTFNIVLTLSKDKILSRAVLLIAAIIMINLCVEVKVPSLFNGKIELSLKDLI